jgi:hypothetical protein
MLLREHCKQEQRRRQRVCIVIAAPNEAVRTESVGSESTDFKAALKVATEAGDKVGEVYAYAGNALLLSSVGVVPSTIGAILYDPQSWANSLSSGTQFRLGEREQQQEQLQNWLRISRHELVDPQLEAHTLICMVDWRLRLWHTHASPSHLDLAHALHCFGRALKLVATIQAIGAHDHPLLLAKAMLRGGGGRHPEHCTTA